MRGEPHGTARLPGRAGSQGLEVPGSLLPGTVRGVQGSHVAGSRDQVDDTDERLEHRDRGGDPEAHSEKAHRANCRREHGGYKGNGMQVRERPGSLRPSGLHHPRAGQDALPCSSPAPRLLPNGPSEKFNR